MKKTKRIIAVFTALVITAMTIFATPVFGLSEPINYNPVIDFQTTDPDIYSQLETENPEIFAYVEETLEFEITFESGFIGRLQFDTTVKTKQDAVNTFAQMTENYLQTAPTSSAPQIISIINTSNSGLGYLAIEFVGEDIDNFVSAVDNMDGVYSIDVSSPSIPGYDNVGNDLENPIYKYNITLKSDTPEDIKTEILALLGAYSEEELFINDEYIFELDEPTYYYEVNGVKYSALQLEILAQNFFPRHYEFLPHEWIADQYAKLFGFNSYVDLTTVDGYTFDRNDFPDLDIQKVSDTGTENRFFVWFNSFDEAYYAVPTLKANPNVLSAGNVYSMVGIVVEEPDIVRLSEIMTDEQIIEKADLICETYGITQDELFEQCGITQSATSPKTYEYNGVEYTEAQMKFVVDNWFDMYADFIPYEYIISEPKASRYISLTKFYPQIAIEVEDGYDGSAITADDFPGAEIVEFTGIGKPNHYILILFNTFDEAYNYIPTAKSLPFVKYAWIEYDPPSIPGPGMSLEDLFKYSTPENLTEHIEEICEAFEITEEELFELCGITQVEPPTEIAVDPTLSGDIDNSGKVQLNDIVILSQALSAQNIDDVLDPQCKANADVLADGVIDSTDLSVFANSMVNSKLAELPISPY